MSGALVVDLMRSAANVTLIVALPLLGTALLVGVLISLAQAVTQIQEQTLTFVPKLAAVAIVFVLTLPWAVRQLVEFMVRILYAMSSMAR